MLSSLFKAIGIATVLVLGVLIFAGKAERERQATSDALRVLMLAQEVHFSQYSRYGSLAELETYLESLQSMGESAPVMPGRGIVTVRLLRLVYTDGYGLEAINHKHHLVCTVFVGTLDGDRQSGQIRCEPATATPE